MANDRFILTQMDYYPGFEYMLSYLEKPEKINNISDFHALINSQHAHKIKNPSGRELSPISAVGKYNILWIVVDTLRFDAINPKLTPNLMEFQKSEVHFNHHMSSGNSTQAGIFGMFYGLPVTYFSASVKHQQEPLLFKMLEKAKYQIHIFYSGTQKFPPWYLNLFSHRTRDQIRQHNTGDVGQDDAMTTTDIIQFLKKQQARTNPKPFFSYLYYCAVHDYCSTQNFPRLYPEDKECNRLNYKENAIGLLQHRYDNAVHFMDSQVAQVIHTLKTTHLLDNTIVIFTSDHGESFNEYQNNIWGHCNGYTDNLLHVPLIIHWPKKLQATVDHVTTHYDLAATLIKYLNTQALEHKYTIGHDLFQAQTYPFVITGSYLNTAIITPETITVLESTGQLEIYNQQGQLLKNAHPNQAHIVQMLKRMREFYE